jgi:hypothetical protein
MAGTHRTDNDRRGKKRNADVIAAEISATCQNLTKTVSDLEDYVKPANIATRGLDAATGFFVDDNGDIRLERAIAAAAAGIALIGLLSRSKKD